MTKILDFLTLIHPCQNYDFLSYYWQFNMGSGLHYTKNTILFGELHEETILTHTMPFYLFMVSYFGSQINWQLPLIHELPISLNSLIICFLVRFSYFFSGHYVKMKLCYCSFLYFFVLYFLIQYSEIVLSMVFIILFPIASFYFYATQRVC